MPVDYKALCDSWKWNIPRRFNMGSDCVDRHAANPDLAGKPALIWESGDGLVKTRTFADLKAATNKIANVFLSFAIARKDRVVIMLENVEEFPLSFLAAVKTGAIPIPVSSMLTPDEVAYIVADSGAKAVVTSPELYGRVEPARTASPDLRTVFTTGSKPPSGCEGLGELMRKSPPDFAPADTLAGDVAYICYTSGTTGEPKGVAHAHRSIIGRDPAALFWTGAASRPTVLHAGKLNWTYTLGAGCLDPWRHGCACVIYGGEYAPAKMFDLIEKHRVNVFMAVPTVFRQMAREAQALSPELSSLSHCLSAGEHLTAGLFSIWKEKLGVLLCEGFGMSEFSYYISNMKGTEIKPDSPGRPQPGRRCFIADPESWEPVPAGEEGVLCSAPDDPGIMLGYWNRPRETRKMFSPRGDFISGDYFKTDGDGYLRPLGRKDDMINSFGYRISPFEIESVLSKHGSVADCAAAGIDAGDGKIITAAFVVLKKNFAGSGLIKRQIRDFLSGRLAAYKNPKEIYFTETIPRTKSGKKKRGELRAVFSKPRRF